MKKLSCLLALLLVLSLAGCGAATPSASGGNSTSQESSSTSQASSSMPQQESSSAPQESSSTPQESSSAPVESAPAQSQEPASSEPQNEPDAAEPDTQEETEMTMNIQIGDHLLTAELVDNSSVEALIQLLQSGPITINMSDYAAMEKVGPFPQSLPRNDEQISTDAGDLILYQGSSFVIYYGPNSWNFTRLGKITNATAQELRDILGSGGITATLSLPD